VSSTHNHTITRFKRKVELYHYGATVHDVRPTKSKIGHDYIILWKCTQNGCKYEQAADLVRELV
jgi:hypothetical protein